MTLAQETYNRQVELSEDRQRAAGQASMRLPATYEAGHAQARVGGGCVATGDPGRQPRKNGHSPRRRSKQAEATLNQRDVDVAELIVRSPISGQITTRVAELGENFSAGAPLFALIDIE